MAKASHIMLEPLRVIAKAPRIMLKPLRIMAKAPRIMQKAPPYIALTPAMAFHKRKPKMKDDHIAYLPYAC
jgi:hypothetical protein